MVRHYFRNIRNMIPMCLVGYDDGSGAGQFPEDVETEDMVWWIDEWAKGLDRNYSETLDTL